MIHRMLVQIVATMLLVCQAEAQCTTCVSTPPAQPYVKVSRYVSNSDLNPDVVYCCAGIEATINVQLLNVHHKVVIQCVPITADLGRVLISGSGTNVVWVIISMDADSSSVNPPTAAAANWDGMQDNRGRTRCEPESPEILRTTST